MKISLMYISTGTIQTDTRLAKIKRVRKRADIHSSTLSQGNKIASSELYGSQVASPLEHEKQFVQ